MDAEPDPVVVLEGAIEVACDGDLWTVFDVETFDPPPSIVPPLLFMDPGLLASELRSLALIDDSIVPPEFSLLATLDDSGAPPLADTDCPR